MDEKRQVQQELFEEFTGRDKKNRLKLLIGAKPRKTYTFFSEQIIFLFIGLVVIVAVVFAIGVEIGKNCKPDIKTRVLDNPSPKDSIVKPSPKPAVAVSVPAVVLPKTNVIPKSQKASVTAGPYLYSIQVASYAKKSEAEKEVLLLESRGFDAFLVSSLKFNVIYVGKFRARQDADTVMKQLKKRYPDCFIKKNN